MSAKFTHAAFLRGRLPGLKVWWRTIPGGCWELGGLPGGGLDSGVAWPRVVSLRLPSGCWPWASQGKAGRLTVGAVAQARRPDPFLWVVGLGAGGHKY